MNKPGYQTSEFWLAVATVIAIILVDTGAISQEQAGPLTQAIVMIAMAIISMAYSASRAKVKSGG